MMGLCNIEIPGNRAAGQLVTLPNDSISVWAARDLDVLESVTRRVRLLETSQARRIWWPNQRTNRFVRRRLNRLARASLLERTIVNVHPLLTLARRLFSWKPGNTHVDSYRVSRQARTRWDQGSVPMEVWTATRQAANLFGTDAYGLTPLLHRDHDLLLSEVYVFYRLARKQEALRWLGEHALPKAGYRVKDPDAFLLGDDGRPTCVIESAGRYSPRQIETFHDHCVAANLPYELW